MQLQDKIELIKILQKKLKLEITVETDISDITADDILTSLKNDVIVRARADYETAEKKKYTKQKLKTWCKQHGIDPKLLDS